jgi:hypothetical protein
MSEAVSFSSTKRVRKNPVAVAIVPDFLAGDLGALEVETTSVVSRDNFKQFQNCLRTR